MTDTKPSRSFKMRIGIREQLAILVLFCCLVSLAVLSIATWETSYNFTAGISASNLQLTAFLYSQQLLANVMFLQSSVEGVATRVLAQNALQRYNNGNNTIANWINTMADLNGALSSGGQNSYLYQARVYPSNATGVGGPRPVVNVTRNDIPAIPLPLHHPNGTQVMLGDADQGYPETLYPTLNYSTKVVNASYNTATASFDGREILVDNMLFLGPWLLNSTFGLCSITVPIVNYTSAVDVLGFETIVFGAQMFFDIADATQGIGSTGVVLITGPTTTTNHFPRHVLYNDPPVNSSGGNQEMHFVVPPLVNGSRSTRHSDSHATFTLSRYPAASQVVTHMNEGLSNSGSYLDTTNEEGDHVSVGFALLESMLVDWVVLVEQSYDEVYEPVSRLRTVILACLFGTLGLVLIFLFPVAHYSVQPIHRLRVATLKSVDPYAYPSEESRDEAESIRSSVSDLSRPDIEALREDPQILDEKKNIIQRIIKRLPGKFGRPARRKSPREGFRIPGKVPDRKHIVQDELTDLTRTFNSMVDELMQQYERLEDKVRERTTELEISKIQAEAANESKTLFIANISHELKTPLNGILGMTAVCMHEDDPTKLKRSLGIIYKSGDLLLNLLTDLLTFSKNQIGRQQLNLDEKEFRLAEISSQVISLFQKQAKEANIHLAVVFEGPNERLETSSGTPAQPGFGPFGTGRVKDMCLYGDQHRILQVVINLVSNSLKFTPSGGAVTVRIRCIGEYDEDKPPSSRASRKNSSQSRQSKTSRISKMITSDRTSKLRSRNSSGSESSMASVEPSGAKRTEVNSRDTKALPAVHVRDRSISPPINAHSLHFEFEVEDTGPGIPPSQQQKVFEPFVQGDLGLTKKYGGTGLGLSICSQLASLMRGSIGLHSVEGEGSTFTMRIPLRYLKERADSTASSSVHNSSRNSVALDQRLEAHTPKRSGSDSNLSTHSAPPGAVLGTFESPSSKPRLVGLSQPFFAASPPLETSAERLEAMERVAVQASQQGGKIRVLVAEDNKVNQEVVLRMLKLEEIYDVTVAKDGQEALDLVKESMAQHQRYDLIFMDIQMPNLDGLQSTRLIREMGYSAPIVALTAFAEESNVQECMDSGMDFFLPKPIRRPQLKQVLKRYCPTIPEAAEEHESPPMSKKTSLRSTSQAGKSEDALANEADMEKPALPEHVEEETTAEKEPSPEKGKQKAEGQI